MISRHYQVYSPTTEYQRASVTFLPTENNNLPFMGHKIPYLSSLLVTCHLSSRLYGVQRVMLWLKKKKRFCNNIPSGSSREVFSESNVFDLIIDDMLLFENKYGQCNFLITGDLHEMELDLILSNMNFYHKLDMLPDDYVENIF